MVYLLIIQINILNNKSSTQVQPRDQVTKNCMFQRASSDAGLGGMMRVAHSTMGGQLMDGYLKCIRCFVYLNWLDLDWRDSASWLDLGLARPQRLKRPVMVACFFSSVACISGVCDFLVGQNLGIPLAAYRFWCTNGPLKWHAFGPPIASWVSGLGRKAWETCLMWNWLAKVV